MSLGSRPTFLPSGILTHSAIWPQQIWAENWWGLCPFGGGGAGSPSNTMWPEPRPTCMPNLILIHPTVWPQCTNVTDRTRRAYRQTGHRENALIAQGELFYKPNSRPKIEFQIKKLKALRQLRLPWNKKNDFCIRKKLIHLSQAHILDMSLLAVRRFNSCIRQEGVG